MLPPGKPGKKGEYIIHTCPKSGCTEGVWWNYLKGVGQCWKCGMKLSWKSFRYWFGMDGKASTSDMGTGKKKDSYQLRLRSELEESLYTGESAWDVDDSRTFLRSKRITRNVCDRVPIKWDWRNRAMLIPVDPVDPGFEPSVLYRRPEGTPDKWIGTGISQSSYVFGYRHIREKLDGIILFEGAHDILATGCLGYGIALLGSDISDNQAKFISSNWTHCVIWLDPDKAGLKGTRVLFNRLKRWGKGKLTIEKYSTAKDPKLYKPDSEEVRIVLDKVGYVRGRSTAGKVK